MKSSHKITILILISFFAIFLTLFQHWEISIETWGYWFFARVFAESGKFIVLQRSPPYTLYLNLFRSLPYPTSVTVEYIVTSFLSIIAIVYIFKSYLGLPLSFLAALLWLPYMQTSEPPVQKIALVINGLAVAVRLQKETRFKVSLSYALLILAYLFRPTYFVFIPLFITLDLIRLINKKQINTLEIFKPKLKTDWPIYTVLLAYLIFQLFQSPISENTVYFSNSKWFPNNGKTEEIFQHYNSTYIWDKYGTWVDHDFYFTNKELFNGASDSFSAFRNNPQFVIQKIANNAIDGMNMINFMTVFSRLDSKSPYVNYFNFLLMAVLIFGAIKGAKNLIMRLYITGCLAIMAATIVFTPQYRYFIFPIIPLFILSAYWYSQFLSRITGKKNWFPITTVILLVVFSPNFTGAVYDGRAYLDWVELGKQIIYDIKADDLRILDNRGSYYSVSMKQSYKEVFPLLRYCKGILSKEEIFIGAFTDIPLSRIYGIWEIPPFGHFGISEYKGLSPDRINCLSVSRELSRGEGGPTNHQVRYQYFIKPYMDDLIGKGAKSYTIPSYGEVVVLE